MSLTRRIAHLERRTRPQRQAEHDGARETLAAKLANLHERLLLADPVACDLASRQVAALGDDTDAAYLEATAALKARIAELVAEGR